MRLDRAGLEVVYTQHMTEVVHVFPPLHCEHRIARLGVSFWIDRRSAAVAASPATRTVTSESRTTASFPSTRSGLHTMNRASSSPVRVCSCKSLRQFAVRTGRHSEELHKAQFNLMFARFTSVQKSKSRTALVPPSISALRPPAADRASVAVGRKRTKLSL